MSLLLRMEFVVSASNRAVSKNTKICLKKKHCCLHGEQSLHVWLQLSIMEAIKLGVVFTTNILYVLFKLKTPHHQIKMTP